MLSLLVPLLSQTDFAFLKSKVTLGFCCLWAQASPRNEQRDLSSWQLVSSDTMQKRKLILSVFPLYPVTAASGHMPKSMHTAFYEKKRSHRKYIKPSCYTVWYAASIQVIPWSAPPVLESVSYLSLTISIHHKGMFDGLWGRWGARRGAALLVGRWDGNSWLPSLATAGALATPQPSERAGGLGDWGRVLSVGKQSKLAIGVTTCTVKHHPSSSPSLLSHTSFPEHFIRVWDKAKAAKSERKQGIWHPVPLLRTPLPCASKEELSHPQEPRMTVNCFQESKVSDFTRCGG